MSIPTLAELRAQIDALDADILAKLSARARCAQQVGESKRAEGSTQVAYYRPERDLAWSRRIDPTVFTWEQFLRHSGWRGEAVPFGAVH